MQKLDIDPSSPLKTLSKGTREKVQLIMVMSRRARVYILDDVIFLKDGQIILSSSVEEIRDTRHQSVDSYFREVFSCSQN